MASDPSRRRRASERERARRRRELRRRRLTALAALLLGCGAVAALIALGLPALKGSSRSPARTDASKTSTTATTSSTTTYKPPPRAPYAVGLQTYTFVDRSRSIQLESGESEPRTLVTEVRYPAVGAASSHPRRGAAPARASGPFPLIVFGHGFELLPSDYSRLLNAWAQAGYVVAAPIFPLESADAPGHPKEEDLVNQPEDMKFVIGEVEAASAGVEQPLSGLVNPEEVAVAGHSDGGDTALSVTYDERFRDPEVKAAVILSGAFIPALGPFAFPPEGPPLLATQGTKDEINQPYETERYFEAAHPPKYLLELLGAKHLEPYTYEQPYLTIVERVTIDFLNRYLKREKGSLRQMLSAGMAPGRATLHAYR